MIPQERDLNESDGHSHSSSHCACFPGLPCQNQHVALQFRRPDAQNQFPWAAVKVPPQAVPWENGRLPPPAGDGCQPSLVRGCISRLGLTALSSIVKSPSASLLQGYTCLHLGLNLTSQDGLPMWKVLIQLYLQSPFLSFKVTLTSSRY